MDIRTVPIEQVQPWADNPRGIKTKDYERLKRQILELGVYKPLLAVKENGGYIVLGGNMRIRALREIGIKEVEVSVVQAKTKAQKIKYALSDNDRAGFYEEDKLAELVYPHLAEIKLEDYKIDLGEPWIDLKRVVERYGPQIDPNAEWEGMPEYENQDLKSFRQILVHFKNQEDVDAFAELVGQKITGRAKYMWYPKAEIMRQSLVIENDKP